MAQKEHIIIDLDPAKALVFRISHRDNLEQILEHGLKCSGLAHGDPYQGIGDPELIEKRSRRVVPIAPGGTLSDYVPFYFTPASPMLYKIITGHNAIRPWPKSEILFIVSSLPKFAEAGIRYLFTDRHAYLRATQFFHRPEDLSRIDWDSLRRRDFKNDPNDPGKMERYQAEALAHQRVPLNGILALACYNGRIRVDVERRVAERGIDLKVVARPGWYFE